MKISKTLSYLLILGAIIGIGLLFWHWHNQTVELKIREANAKLEGEVKQLMIRDSAKSVQVASYKAIIDSALKIKHDTISLYNTLYVTKNNVLALGTDGSISRLANNLSH